MTTNAAAQHARSSAMPRWRSLASVLASAVLVATSCGDGTYRDVSKRSLGVYLKVPSDWQAFDQEALRPLYASEGKEASGTGIKVLEQVKWERAFDGARVPKIEHLVPGNADAPTARVVVRVLTDKERAVLSLDLLRNTIHPDYVELRDEYLNRSIDPDNLVNPDLEPILDRELSMKGYFGVELRFKVRDEAGNLHEVAQIAATNDARTLLYVFIAHCNQACFEANRGLVDVTVKSFSLKEPHS